MMTATRASSGLDVDERDDDDADVAHRSARCTLVGLDVLDGSANAAVLDAVWAWPALCARAADPTVVFVDIGGDRAFVVLQLRRRRVRVALPVAAGRPMRAERWRQEPAGSPPAPRHGCGPDNEEVS